MWYWAKQKTVHSEHFAVFRRRWGLGVITSHLIIGHMMWCVILQVFQNYYLIKQQMPFYNGIAASDINWSLNLSSQLYEAVQNTFKLMFYFLSSHIYHQLSRRWAVFVFWNVSIFSSNNVAVAYKKERLQIEHYHFPNIQTYRINITPNVTSKTSYSADISFR